MKHTSLSTSRSSVLSRRHLPLVFSLLLASLTQTTLPAAETMVLGEPPTPTATETIRGLEDECRRAVTNADFATLERLWSERFVVNNPANAISPSRAAVFELFRRRVRGGRLYSMYDQRIDCIAFDGDLAIVMGHEVVAPPDAPADAQPMSRRFTNVWRLAKGEWRLIARQATMLAPGAPGAPGVPGVPSAK